MATASDVCLTIPEAAVNPRYSLFQEVIDNFVSEGSQSSLSFVVIGEAGQGKSTLINGLVGQQIAKEGDEFDPGTTGLDRYRLNQNGVQVDIWDTPGFGMASQEEEKKTLEEMARDIKRVDLVLYCMRIDSKRWPKNNDVNTIVRITEVFTKKIWSHSLFVLTFANCAAQHLSPEDDEDTLGPAFSRHCIKWEDRIREQIRKLAQLSNKEADNIRAVPVGSYVSKKRGESPWALPDREDWFISFWLDITAQMREAALPSLLKLNRHRFANYMPSAETEPEDPDQDSVNPIVVTVEVHARALPGSYSSELDADNPGAQISDDRPGAPYTNGGWSRSHKLSVDENIYNEEPTASDGGVEKSDETGGAPEPQKPSQRKIPIHRILSSKLDQENSGFWKYVTEFAKLRGQKVPAIGHVGGFIEGLLQYLGNSRRKRNKVQEQESTATQDITQETHCDC